VVVGAKWLPLWMVVAAACGGGSSAPTERPVQRVLEPAPRNAPTVILVSIDTLRPDRLGCYGNRQPTSPNIDRFADQAVFFAEAIAQAPSTLPSHATMFTSLLPEHHGAFFSRRTPLPPSIPTLATVLRAAGYRTAAFTGGGQIAPEFGLDRGFDTYGVNVGGPDFESAVRAGLGWLGEDLGQPAFLFLHTYEVHHPFTPDPALLAVFDGGYEGPLPAEISKDLLHRINTGEMSITDRDLRHIVAAYDAEIRSVDSAFGHLLAGLVELALFEDSLVIFTSDHGEEFGEHGLVGWHSHTLFDELLRVPLLIRFPGGRNGGRSIAEQVRLLDLAPTVLGEVGVVVPSAFEGVDLARVIGGLPTSLPAASQLDLPAGDVELSLRTKRWKLYPRRALASDPFAEGPPPLRVRFRNLITRWRSPFALFDLRDDPGERSDVVEGRPQVAASLSRTLETLAGMHPIPAPEPTVVVDLATEERLRALGYVD
jgi:arylsulfatase A-like enzyme